jgi:hypothetical protein
MITPREVMSMPRTPGVTISLWSNMDTVVLYIVKESSLSLSWPLG